MTFLLEFPTKYNFLEVRGEAEPSNPGSDFRPVYQSYYDDDGILQVEQVGEENLFDEIQTFADSVDINIILRRFGAGDASVLNKVPGFFGDVSDAPNSLVDMLNVINSADQYFERLPLSIREQFNNSVTEFIAAADSPDFLKIIGVKKVDSSTPAQPVVSDSQDVQE